MALVTAIGLGLQFQASAELTGSALAALWVMLRYFTVVANVLLAGVLAAHALGVARAGVPTLLGGVTLAMLLVGIVYGLLLRGMVELSGGAELADTLLHNVTPSLVTAFWLLFVPKGHLRWRDPLVWTVLPALYFSYALARGSLDGHYPYPFMNLARLGGMGVAVNAALIAAGFLLGGTALVALDRLMGRSAVTRSG